jgi:hypothetical protein
MKRHFESVSPSRGVLRIASKCSKCGEDFYKYPEGECVREIKFRAWDKTQRIMYEWADILDWNTRQFKEALTLQKTKETISEDSWVELDLMQFTGFNDQNGKEIYDGDIIRHDQGVDKVHWLECGWSVGSWTPGDLYGFSNVEVIGNIYENPEVVK